MDPKVAPIPKTNIVVVAVFSLSLKFPNFSSSKASFKSMPKSHLVSKYPQATIAALKTALVETTQTRFIKLAPTCFAVMPPENFV